MSPGWTVWQNLWKTEPWKTAAKPFANKTLVFDVPDDGAESGEISLKFAATGAVTAKYGAYSCSSVLIPVAVGRYSTFLYFPPKAGKFDGYGAEVPLVWNGVDFTLVK